MKIVYIIGTTMMTGATISFKIILEGMLAKRCEIIVLVSDRNPNKEFIDYITKKGCIVEMYNAEAYVYPPVSLFKWQHSFVKFPLRLLRKLSNIFRSQEEVLQLLKKYNPDIVHTNVGVLHQGFYACRKLGIPHVWHLREYQTKDFGWTILPTRFYFSKLLRKSNVITITKDILNYFKLQNSKRAIALWDAVLPKSEVYYNDKKDPYFLCANRISPEKKVEDVILAFSKISSKLPAQYKLLIVGDQHNEVYMTKLNALIEESSCADKIEIRPHQHDVTLLMQNATALIVASQFEGLGRMTLESIFKGCLVLGRATGGTKEILENTRGGFLFTTVDELAQYMLFIANMENPDDYKNMINYAQEIAIEKASNENYNDIIYDVYKNIIGSKFDNKV